MGAYCYQHKGLSIGLSRGMELMTEFEQRVRDLADAIWAESQADQTVIRDAGIMQDIVLRIDAITGEADRG